MSELTFWFFILLIPFLDLIAAILYKKLKLNIIVSGIIMLFLAPVLSIVSGSLMIEYEHSKGLSGEGSMYAGYFIGLVMLVNAIIILIIGILLWLEKRIDRTI